MQAREPFPSRRASRKIGKHIKRTVEQLHLEKLRVPNPFNDWMEANSIDTVALAIQTGIRTVRIHALRTGIVLPHFHETVMIERATAGGFPMTAWVKQPQVMAMLQRCAEKGGVPTIKWIESRMGSGIYLQNNGREYMRTFCEEWLRLQAAESPAGAST